jgi:hypothetical protein
VKRNEAALIDERLRAACAAQPERLVDPNAVDMSAEAITHRLREAAEMSTLCLELASAG